MASFIPSEISHYFADIEPHEMSDCVSVQATGGTPVVMICIINILCGQIGHSLKSYNLIPPQVVKLGRVG